MLQLMICKNTLLEFIGHATADNMVTVFETATTSDPDLSDLLQLSMDGPDVNLKF